MTSDDLKEKLSGAVVVRQYSIVKSELTKAIFDYGSVVIVPPDLFEEIKGEFPHEQGDRDHWITVTVPQ